MVDFSSYCSDPATTIIRSHDRAEMYCDKHWEERVRKAVKPIICVDCGT